MNQNRYANTRGNMELLKSRGGGIGISGGNSGRRI